MEVSQKLVIVALAEVGEHKSRLPEHPSFPGQPTPALLGITGRGWHMVAVLGGGGRATTASGPERQKERDSHARVMGGGAGCAAVPLARVSGQGLPLEQEFDSGWRC